MYRQLLRFQVYKVRFLKLNFLFNVIGVFTGASSLAAALALPPEGQVIACDISHEYTSQARAYWQEAGVEAKVRLHIAPAQDTLQKLLDDGQALCLKILTKFSLLSRYELTLILKPLPMLFHSLKILLNSCRFFLYCKIAELRRIFKGQKSIYQGFLGN